MQSRTPAWLVTKVHELLVATSPVIETRRSHFPAGASSPIGCDAAKRADEERVQRAGAERFRVDLDLSVSRSPHPRNDVGATGGRQGTRQLVCTDLHLREPPVVAD